MHLIKKAGYLFIISMVFSVLFLGTGRAEAAVKVKSVTVKSNYGKKVHVAEGKKVKLTTAVTVTPNTAANRKPGFRSTNTKVATVTSSGYVKGVAAGTCKVKVYARANKKKQAKITVKVVKPVTEIAFAEDSGSLYVGEQMTLKKTVTPSSGSFKSVTWSSSHPGIATVSSAGKIKAVAAGSTVIKAKSVEGSGQTAKYKLKVLSADTISLDSVEVLSEHVVRVRLDKAAVLQKENFAVDGKRYSEGKFIHTFDVWKMRNYDNKTYDLTLKNNYRIQEDSFVRVRIAALPGNGTKSKTTQVTYIKTGTSKEKYFLYRVGQRMEVAVSLDDYCIGDIAYTVTGLPECLSAYPQDNTLMICGDLTEAMPHCEIKVVAEDEMGGKAETAIHVCVGSEDVVVAAAEDVTMLIGSEEEEMPFAEAMGGSGQYTFVASGLPLGVTMKENGELTGTAAGAGDYEVVITAIDKEDSTRVGNAVANVHVADPRKVIGSVTDAEGKAVSGAAIECTNVNTEAKFVATSDSKGTYSVFVEEGSYNIRLIFGDFVDYIYDLVVSSGGRQLDFVVE